MIEEIVEKMQAGGPPARLFKRWPEAEFAVRFERFQLMRLQSERAASDLVGNGCRLRVAATACWEFPIYSQTFVYQELAALMAGGFQLRFLYSKLNGRDQLPAQFSPLWRGKRKLVFHPEVCERAYAHYRQQAPGKIEELVEKLCAASGMSRQELCGHYHFQQAFAFTRMVEACRPDYLHSYFFYEGTLFTLFASHLLDIPRGVSCYADHMLHDYVLKVIPLHLEQCSLVIATSERIKRELMHIAPHADPDRIVVKPNAVDTGRFPQAVRNHSPAGEPYRLICVSRVEPKKGLIYLVEAVRHLLDRGLRVELHLVGGVDDNSACRDYARDLDQRIEALRLGEFVHRAGRKTAAEVRALLEGAQLFVAPFVETESGDKDGIPTSLLEAMSSGMPAVATDAGSIGEVITDGRDGVLVPQRDSLGLARAIEALLLDPPRRQQMGDEAASKIRRCFEVGSCERRFHERIRAVVDARRRSQVAVQAAAAILGSRV